MSRQGSSGGSRRLRVTVNLASRSDTRTNLPKVMLVPDSLQMLLDEATQKLDMPQCARLLHKIF